MTVSDAPLLQAEVEKLKAENQELRKLLGAPFPASWQFIPAKILSLKDDRLTLNVGSKDGVETGMNVLVLGEANQGIVIGKIAGADQYLAKVNLISDARVKTPTGAVGKLILQGQTLKLIEVEQKHNLEPGELVLTEGKDGWLPDLLVGRVGKIEKIATAVYQSAAIEPLLDFQAISRVVIVRLPLEN